MECYSAGRSKTRHRLIDVPFVGARELDSALALVGNRAQMRWLSSRRAPPSCTGPELPCSPSRRDCHRCSGGVSIAMPADFLSYGANQRATYFRLATYADRILRGETPADIPVEQPTNFELVVNLSTAKALRIEVPKSILLRADRVIE